MSLKQDIMAAIGKTDDPNMKVVLIFMLGMMEEIVGKIDAMRADEQGLREAVLNVHTGNHDSDHNWVQERRKAECEINCRWVADRRKAESEDAKANIDSKRKIRDGLIEKMVWAVLVLAAGSGWFLK